ncbi:MAG: response regulator [Pyrinomonadaceae bacterium]
MTTPRILVADDDASTSELLSSAGQQQGYKVVSVADGREAFRLLRRDADFSLVIFNLTMPHLPGVDIVRHMKTEKRLMSIPVILVSGEGGLRNVADCFAAGAIAFLAKPFGLDQLRLTIRLALSTRTHDKALQLA